jgi:hypothetical protein
MLPLIVLIQVEIMTNFSVIQKVKVHNLFTQFELNDVIRDLGLSKEKSELLGSGLKEKNVLAAGASMYWYRRREQEFTRYFSQDGDLVYCCNIPGLMQKFGVEYKVNGIFSLTLPREA